MNVQTERLEDSKVAMTITVPQDVVAKAYEQAWKKIASQVEIHGFRKGKAPRKIVENRVGVAAIREEAFEIIANKAYPEALEKEDIEPVGQPTVEIITMEEDKDMVMKITVAVKPDVELGEYKDLEVETVEKEVTDEDVDKSLKMLLDRKAEMIVVEDAQIEKGDFAIIDFSGFIDGVPFDGGEGKSYPLEIGSGSFIPGFEDQLIGAKTGEERTVKVSFPEDYFTKELAGKEAEFKVKVYDIKRKKLPEVTDEFIKENTKIETLDEWRKESKERLQKAADEQAAAEQENSIIRKAVENAKVTIPVEMIQQRVEEIIHDMAHNLQDRGLKFEDYLKYIGKNIDELKASYEESALADIKAELVMDAIAKKEAIEVEAKELQKELELMAEQYKQPIDDIKKALVQTGNITRVNLAILRRKAARFVLGKKDEEKQEEQKEQENKE